METLITVLILLLMLWPAISIAFSTERSIRTRVVWGLAAALSPPLAIGGWVTAIALLKPPGGIHSSYGAVASVFAFFAPWVVFWVFKRTRPHTMPTNPTPHADARDVPASANGSGARAGGRER